MFDETDFKHTQWTLDCCVADESVTFIQEIQENFFEPLIGKKQNKKPNKHYFSHYRVTRTYRGGSVLMLRSGGRFKGSHFKHKALVNIKITAKNKKTTTKQSFNSYTSNNSVGVCFCVQGCSHRTKRKQHVTKHHSRVTGGRWHGLGTFHFMKSSTAVLQNTPNLFPTKGPFPLRNKSASSVTPTRIYLFI